MGSVVELESHRSALTGHCYRMLGSIGDADDAVQETMIRAWKGLEGFDGRSALRTWLYRIATNVCLDAIEKRGRRWLPMEGVAPNQVPASPFELQKLPRTHWLEPVPDVAAIPADENPYEQARLRQTIRLAFVAALQELAPKQRAALLLMEVLGLSAAETAETLEMTVAAVNSALQRARATMEGRAGRLPDAKLTAEQEQLLERYVAAFERYDVEGLTSLLREDVQFSMPPYTLWLEGPEQVGQWLGGFGSGCRGSRLVAVEACGGPAFGQYRVDPEGGWKPWALALVEWQGDKIVSWTSFLDTDTLFPRFGLPEKLT